MNGCQNALDMYKQGMHRQIMCQIGGNLVHCVMPWSTESIHKTTNANRLDSKLNQYTQEVTDCVVFRGRPAATSWREMCFHIS